MKKENKTTGAFTDAEREAMRAHVLEMKAEERANKNRADGEKAALEAIAALTGQDKTLAERLHAIIKENAPDLWPKTWYGMPAYTKDGKVVCFFQSAQKFKTKYATFGFQQDANLDAGAMWPVAFALTKLTPTEENQIIELVKRAVS